MQEKYLLRFGRKYDITGEIIIYCLKQLNVSDSFIFDYNELINMVECKTKSMLMYDYNGLRIYMYWMDREGFSAVYQCYLETKKKMKDIINMYAFDTI